MPYIIKQVKDGMKVCKKSNPNECYSKHGMPLERAKRQLKAIGMHESKKAGKKQILKEIPQKLLLLIAKGIAKERGYDPSKLRLSKDGKHKLEYEHNNKWIKFGRSGYNDFITYMYNHYLGNITYATAVLKMKNYRKRAYSVMKKTGNIYSPASLSYYILW